MMTRSEVDNAAISPDLQQQQQAGFLLLAVVPAEGLSSADVEPGSLYRLELVDRRKQAVLKGCNGCVYDSARDGIAVGSWSGGCTGDQATNGRSCCLQDHAGGPSRRSV